MCIHHWAQLKANNGHTIYVCTECPTMVDFTAARAEYDRRETKSPEEQRWPLVQTEAS